MDKQNMLKENSIYAHTPPQDASNKWHLLNDHLIATARSAAAFAKPFGSANTGFMLGIYHDLGKVNPEFQEYLQACVRGEKRKSAPHSACGASYLWKTLLRHNSGDASLAICALGHHGGLPSHADTATQGGKLEQWWSDIHNKKRISPESREASARD